MWETTCQFLLLVPFIVYFAVKYYLNYWTRKGIPNVKCNLLELDWYHVSLFDYYNKIYNKLSGKKFGGCFLRLLPTLMIRDPELIRNILIEDFDHFHHRADVVFDENEPITMHMLGAPGAVWKRYFAIRYNYNYWKRKSIPFIEVNIFDPDWYHMSLFDYFKKIYNQLSGHKFGGCFFCFSPRLVIRDLELINSVLIKDFDFFHNRGDVFFDENEPITMHMFGAPRPLWKNLRTTLTPTFTSGKMKHMFNLMQECADELVDVIENDTKTENVIDVKDYCTRYTIEVISSCAFGLKTNSIKNPDSIFKVMVHQIFERTISRKIILWTKSICPSVKRLLKLKLINKSVTEFFNKLTENNVNYRRTNGIDRNDFLQLLIKMLHNERQQELKGQIRNIRITNEFMTAQCFLFFIGGLETSSTTLILSLYELAANRQIQIKLQGEIEAYLKKYDGQVTYEMMKNMPYLHQVVSETMRKYPVLATLSRVCSQNYQIPNSETIIEKGTQVVIPISGLHRDPEYFLNPEKFDPDRFEEGNSVNCYAYLPFGDGPRNCIGSRFGLMTVKLGLIHLLRNYNFELSPKTKYPFEFTPLKVVTSINHEMLLKCSKK